ncbi:DUF2332 domain-containing protein, partial [Microlunatus capsulatus]|uniref:DUF2332 domain-containing protein n=1 Tax=Microlunatus capsulatus TaxID=99117 RepID=UPI0031D7522A
PARARRPAAVLAALHDLVLADRAPVLAAAWAAGDGAAVADAAVATLQDEPGAVAERASRRLRTEEVGRHAVLRPLVAEAARRAGAAAVGLVGLGCSAGFDLHLDRVGVRYDAGPVQGDPTSPRQVAASVVGGRAVPTTRLPAVLARVGVDREPLDVADDDAARWLHACLGPDAPAAARVALEAEVVLARAVPRVLLAGDVVDLLPTALARVPAGALPVVTTTWALGRLSPGDRARFADGLRTAAERRPLAWVSAEGVGVAPGVPTLGDRPASGHSILAVTFLDSGAGRVEALGRCWSRGRQLSWLVDDGPGWETRSVAP